jgi:drug/metabolite transporter (DMT)-like permease
MLIGWGEFFSVAAAVTWAFSVILLRRAGETLPPFELNLLKNGLGFILLIPTLWLFSARAWPGYTGAELGIMLMSGFIGIALADTLYLMALNRLGAARTGIVASFYSPFVIILSMLFLAEAMSLQQWAGFAMVMTGVLLVTWRRERGEVTEPDLRIGMLLGIGAVLLMACAIVMVKDVLETRPFLWTVEIRLAGGLLGMMAIATIRGRWSRVTRVYRQPQPWGIILTASFLGAYLAMIFWLAGYRLTLASVASVLNESSSAFIVLFAWLFLREPVSMRRFLGLSLALGGVLVMLLSGVR